MTIPSHPDLPMLTEAEYADELARAADLVRHILTTEPLQQDFTPVLVAHTFDPESDDTRIPVTVCPLLGFDMDKRREILHAVGAEFAGEQKIVRAIFFLSEAWISKQEAGEPRRYAQPADDPARREIILIAGLTLDGRSCMGRVHVGRDEDNLLVAGETELFAYGPDAEVEVTNRICAHFFIGYQEALKAMMAEGGAV